MIMVKKDIREVYESRPFKTRNADEFDIESVLDLFVDPTEGLISPFDYENSIIKGRMGTGKTMYLRANYAYYIYTLVPSLLEEADIVLPIYIKLSDFQNISTSDEIYKSLVIRILKEITITYLNLQDSRLLTDIHKGIQGLTFKHYSSDRRIHKIVQNISKMSSDEYIEFSSKAINGGGGFTSKFINLSSEYSKKIDTQLKTKPNPGIEDIDLAYQTLLKPFNGKLLLLIDEAGSLSKAFFKENGDLSMFETLMNQLRTLSYIRTKIAIYPQTHADVLLETRYGDAIHLQDNIKNIDGYHKFLNRSISLLDKYISSATQMNFGLQDILEVSTDNMELIEQIINASNGNTRRLVHIMDMVFNSAFSENKGLDKISISSVNDALKLHGRSLEFLFSETEIDFLETLVSTCKTRSTFKFRIPSKSIDMQRYTSKSLEYNVVSVVEQGAGRKGTVYEFDYAYAVYREIPTHYVKNTERIDRQRSSTSGQWISKITNINDNIIEHSKIVGKIEGKIEYIGSGKQGFILADDNQKYFFMEQYIIENDKSKKIHVGSKVRFLPTNKEETLFAYYLEIL